jgi:hypothetical protein
LKTYEAYKVWQDKQDADESKGAKSVFGKLFSGKANLKTAPKPINILIITDGFPSESFVYASRNL